jgi:hypothetical protein
MAVMIAVVYARESTGQSAVTVEGRPNTSSLARFGGHFSCFYLLLVWLPWCLGFFGVSFGWWFDVGQWSITHILRLPEHFVDSPTAGNVLTHYVSTAVFVLVSTALATIWLAVDRRGITYPIAFVCAFVLARFLLAGYMMGYGWIKVLPAQFGRMASGAGTDYLMQQVGQLPPTDLLWAFMEASRPYQVFAGLIELVGGLLLLTRRTTMLGAFVSAAAMLIRFTPVREERRVGYRFEGRIALDRMIAGLVGVPALTAKLHQLGTSPAGFEGMRKGWSVGLSPEP